MRRRSGAMEIAENVSPLLEALFAADKIAKPAGGLTALWAINAPGADAKVNQNDVAVKLLEYAFLWMHETGALELDVVEKKTLFVKSTSVQVKLGSQPLPKDGVIGGIMSNVVDGKTAYDAIYDWFRRPVANPYSVLVQAVLEEAIAAGFLVKAHQNVGGAVGNTFRGVLPTERVPERAADIEALRQAGAQRWAGFNAKDGALVEQVLKQCSSALNSRTASRNTGSSDF
jgi:hypothetical protein